MFLPFSIILFSLIYRYSFNRTRLISKHIEKVIFCKSIPRASLCQERHPRSKRSKNNISRDPIEAVKIKDETTIKGIILEAYDSKLF